MAIKYSVIDAFWELSGIDNLSSKIARIKLVLAMTYIIFLFVFASFVYFKFLDYKIGNDKEPGNAFSQKVNPFNILLCIALKITSLMSFFEIPVSLTNCLVVNLRQFFSVTK